MIRNHYNTAKPVLFSRYLARRGLANIIHDPRFADTVRMNDRNSILFPHFDLEGLCGFEIKGVNFTGFATGGKKGLWFSNFAPNDCVLVISESGIDAMSFHLLYHPGHHRYASTAGGIGSNQKELIRVAANEIHKQGGFTVCAFDNDDQGRRYVEMVRELLSREQRKMMRVAIPKNHKDWNDLLVQRIHQGRRTPEA